jgi:hypothetical protein
MRLSGQRELGHVDRLRALEQRLLRVSAIVDARFRLIVDGKTALPLTRWGSTQVLG